jgi:hypothetical protein
LREYAPQEDEKANPALTDESSEAELDSDDGWNPPRVDLSKIPRWLFHPFTITPGRLKWECPQCTWVLDLLKIPPDHPLHGVEWKALDDPPVRRFLTERINGHYDDHIWDCGYKWVERKGKRYLAPIKEGEVIVRTEGSHYSHTKSTP